MKEKIRVLVKLQHLDIESARIASILGDVAQKIENLDSDLNGIEQTIKNQESIANELKKQYREHESDVKVNLGRNQKNQEKLRAVKTNKEYQALLKEIEDIKAKNSLIEDNMLECLDRMDEIDKIIEKKIQSFLSK